MQLTRIVDVALSSPAKVKVLRRLALDTRPRSGRALAREVGMSHARVLHVLDELHENGIVKFERVGRAYAFSLARASLPVGELLLPLFRKEDVLAELAASRIASSVRTPTISVSMFGSVAKRSDDAASDLDLVFVVQTKERTNALEAELAGAVADFATSLGVRIGPYVVTPAELARRYRSRDRFIRDVVASARRVSGRTLMEVISAGSSKAQDAKR